MEEYQEREFLAEFLKDATKYLPSIIIPGLVGFITIPIITHLFPASIYGDYVLVMATVSIFSIFVGWVAISVIRFYPAYERQREIGEFYGTALKLTALSIGVLASVYVVALLIGKALVSQNLFSLMRIGLLVFIFTSLFGVLQEFLRAKRRAGWYTGFSLCHSVAGLGLGLLLIMLFHRGIEGLLWGYISSILMVLPLLYSKARERSSVSFKGISRPLVSEMAKYGFPLVVGNLAAWILSLSDRYILGMFRGSSEVGIYSASYGICATSFMLVVSLFRIAAGPIAMHIWERQGEKPSERFTSGITRYYLIALVPMVVGLSVLAKPVISILTAPEYHDGYRIVPMVVLSTFFLGLTHRYGIGFSYRKVTYYAALTMVASGLLNLGLNFLLIPRYGYMAAAATTLISYTFFLILQILISRRFFVWEFPLKSMAKVALASAVMGAVVYPVGTGLTSSILINLILGICVGVVIYFVMLILLREPRKEEIQELRAIGKRILRK